MNRIYISVILGALGVAAAADTPQEPAPGIVVHEGLVFSEPDEALRMDLFLPASSPKPVPCVIVIQGGGFLAQDGKKFRPFAEYLAGNGFAAALIAYRGRPHHTCLETIADVKAAVRFVRKCSGEYNINPEKIGTMGRSAGGTLAALLAVTGGMEEFEGRGDHLEFSSRIQAAVAYAGIFDFIARFTDKQQISLQPKGNIKKDTNREWIGEDFSPENLLWQAVSAINHVDASDPPMLLVHCKDDATVPWIQSENMALKMRAAGVHVETEYYETGGHGFATPDHNAPMAQMVAFFQKTLSK